ncbi:hypothetical protein L208DRAFT_1327948 [Tricholoma matsutake]|nr:hypothetical protein L208DRAFT_1327948 [Tricholoma matsutake 945]
MEEIIKERGLWPVDGLLAQCKGFKCKPGHTNFCCRRILFTQPDFVSQKSWLEEFVTSCGHICDFYLKYHCELNFIEKYWGTAKLQYCITACMANIVEMEKNMLNCLDDVPLLQMRRYVNRSACFMSTYDQGLSGVEAAWANHKYYSHHTLPPVMAAAVRRANVDMVTSL